MDNSIQQRIWATPGKIKNVFAAPQPNMFIRLSNAKKVGFEGTLLSLPFVALSVANAPQGYRVADAISGGISELVITPALTAVAFIGLSIALPGIGTGIAAAVLASGLASAPSSFIATRLNRGVRQFKDVDKNLMRLSLGYTDTDTASLHRQTAIRDMSGAFGNARRYLGNEAYHLHR